MSQLKVYSRIFILFLKMYACNASMFNLQLNSELDLTFRPSINAWSVLFPSFSTSSYIYLTQVCTTKDSNGSHACFIDHPKTLQTCQEVYKTVNENGWFSVSMNKSETEENEFCEILQEKSHLTHFKNLVADNLVTASYPPGLQISKDIFTKDNVQELQNLNSCSNGLFCMQLKVTYLVSVFSKYSVVEKYWNIILKAPFLPSEHIVLKHICAARNLELPENSAFLLLGKSKDICSWKCRDDHIRFPWNTELKIINTTATCKELPRSFVALEFSYMLEFKQAGISPLNLDQSIFDGIDELAAMMQVRDNTVSCKVRYSMYDFESYFDVIKNHVNFINDNSAYEQVFSMSESIIYQPNSNVLAIDCVYFNEKIGKSLTSDYDRLQNDFSRINPNNVKSFDSNLILAIDQLQVSNFHRFDLQRPRIGFLKGDIRNIIILILGVIMLILCCCFCKKKKAYTLF